MLIGSGNRLAAPPSSHPKHPPSCPQLYCLDAGAVAEEVGLGRRVNMVMQSAFFALSGVMSMDKVRAAGGAAGHAGVQLCGRPSPAGSVQVEQAGLLGAVAVERPSELLMRWDPALQAAALTLPLSSLRPAAGHPAAQGVDQEGVRQEG